MSDILIELTATIVSSHASTVEMTTEALLQEIQSVYATLKQLETGSTATDTGATAAAPTINPKKSIQKDQVICLICGKGGFKTLSRHLRQVHGIKPGAYRKQFGIPANTPLAAKNYSEARRKAALDNNLGEKLAEGRQKRLASIAKRKAEAPPVAPKKPGTRGRKKKA